MPNGYGVEATRIIKRGLPMNEAQLILLTVRALGFVLALQLPLKKTLPTIVWISLIVMVLLMNGGSENLGGASPGFQILAQCFGAITLNDFDSLAHTWSQPNLLLQNTAIGLSLGLVASVVGYAVYFIAIWLASLSLGHYFDLAHSRFEPRRTSIEFVVYILFGYLLFSVVGFSNVGVVFTETLIAVPVDKTFDSSLTLSKFVPLLASVGAKSFEFGLLCVAPLLLIGLLVDITFAVVNRYASALATADIVYAVRQPVVIFVFAALTILFAYVLSSHLSRSIERARVFGGKYLTTSP